MTFVIQNPGRDALTGARNRIEAVRSAESQGWL
jgi:hypothetical protein